MSSALIVIDVQESFRQRPLWEAVPNPWIVEQVNRLVDAARARGDLVIWVLHAEPGTRAAFDPGYCIRRSPAARRTADWLSGRSFHHVSLGWREDERP
jgi:nicotinamidase-related amidase